MGRHAGSGKFARWLARIGTPLSVAPCPATATHSSPRRCRQHPDQRPPGELTSATDTAQPGRPRTKSRVPSIGSTSQISPLCGARLVVAVSSESHAAEGSSGPARA
jgi:hypothetical protein